MRKNPVAEVNNKLVGQILMVIAFGTSKPVSYKNYILFNVKVIICFRYD